MGLAVQPWPHPHQVEIKELQVPHAYVEDESLWLAQLWCEFIVQSISHLSTIYNPTTKICVIWSVHLGCLVHVPLYHNCSELVWCDRIGRSFLKLCGKLPNGTLPRRRASLWDNGNSPLTLMAIRINVRRSANHGMRSARRNSRRSGRQGATHSLVRHERILSRNNQARLSTSGSNQDKSLWGHYCGKSPAMRTHASSQATRPPTPTSPASVCVDSNWSRVEGVRSAIFFWDKE